METEELYVLMESELLIAGQVWEAPDGQTIMVERVLHTMLHCKGKDEKIYSGASDLKHEREWFVTDCRLIWDPRIGKPRFELDPSDLSRRPPA